MPEEKDNVVRVDFRRKTYVDDDRPVAPPEEVPTPEPAQPSASAAEDSGKKERFAEMIDAGLVMVTFDTRADGVSVPEQFTGTPQLHLSFSYRFQVEDFEYDDDGIRATLSFDAGDHLCIVPWDAVYALQSRELSEKVVFPASFPAELLALLPSLGAEDDESD